MEHETMKEMRFLERDPRTRVPDTQMDNCLAIMSSQTFEEALYFLKRAWRSALAESRSAYKTAQGKRQPPLDFKAPPEDMA